MIKLFQMAMVSLILVSASGAVRADDFGDAMAASRRGDYAKAVKESATVMATPAS